MNKKMKALVIGSLLLNVLLVGFVLGDVSHRFHNKEHFGENDGRDLTSKLPKEKAALFSKTVERVRQENRQVFKQIREAREDAMRILGAPEFDEAAYRLQVERLNKLLGLMKQHLADATIELARQFSQEERSALAQHLRHSPRHPQDNMLQRDGKISRREEP
jgi:uncharacterized membrane protein